MVTGFDPSDYIWRIPDDNRFYGYRTIEDVLNDLNKRIKDLESERQYLNKLASEQYYTIKELQEKLKKRRATWG